MKCMFWTADKVPRELKNLGLSRVEKLITKANSIADLTNKKKYSQKLHSCRNVVINMNEKINIHISS